MESVSCGCPTSNKTAIAAIVNALAPNDSQILEFYTTAYRNVGVRVRKVESEDDDPEFKPWADATELGPVLTGTPLVTLKFKNQIRVYGISRYTDGGENKICCLSPGFDYTGKCTKLPVLAGTGDGKNQGWLYELEDRDDGRFIREHNISGGFSSTEMVPFHIWGESQLAAFYDNDSNTRYVVYQNNNHNICFKQMDDNSADPTTCNGTSALEVTTPLSACAISSNFFIFFVSKDSTNARDKSNYLHVAFGAIGTSGKTNIIKRAQVVNEAYLSAVPVKNATSGKYDIWVFYLNPGEKAKQRSLAHYVHPTNIPI
ncbi:hypothetical protein ABW19_dt0200412 [Dactylella cylindrospora]|nr:hypothetical protein ABW19_dt0200412 [Dactylella cylindrospora]